MFSQIKAYYYLTFKELKLPKQDADFAEPAAPIILPLRNWNVPAVIHTDTRAHDLLSYL